MPWLMASMIVALYKYASWLWANVIDSICFAVTLPWYCSSMYDSLKLIAYSSGFLLYWMLAKIELVVWWLFGSPAIASFFNPYPYIFGSVVRLGLNLWDESNESPIVQVAMTSSFLKCNSTVPYWTLRLVELFILYIDFWMSESSRLPYLS